MTWHHGAWQTHPDPDVPAGANDYHALTWVKARNGSTFFVGTDFGVGAWMPRQITSRGLYDEMARRAEEEGSSLGHSMYRRSARLTQIEDGLSKTALVLESGGQFDFPSWVGRVHVGSWALSTDERGTTVRVDLAEGRYYPRPWGHLYVHPHVAMCDGSVHAVAVPLNSKILWALITRTGDELIRWDR